MAISSSLYSSISGLSTMGEAMSVLGDNVANVNTVAFKASRTTFQDVLTQSVSTASGAAQLGRGTTLSTIEGLFAQGSFESSASATDMAIGGQGFFMLRAEGSAESDMYTRAGEFSFDQEGFIVSNTGEFVQGWTIDSTTGEPAGTIGDMRIDTTTPPVATDLIEVICNVDSREENEVNEEYLFDSWDGTNASGVNPTEPIDATNYEYSTSIKIYDSKGASHDLTIYFDRTTMDNQWEFLVSCEPSEDFRGLDTREQTIYVPDETYNYEAHKGAGALMWGVLDFDTSGQIIGMTAFDVPPDGKVDPALDMNLLTLGSTDNYYSFEVNFTGNVDNDTIELNLGAQYAGIQSGVSQTLVSDLGALAGNTAGAAYITSETYWSDVYDANGLQLTGDGITGNSDSITITGFDNLGQRVSSTYDINSNGKVQELLTQISNDFNCTATIDAYGRLIMTDLTSGLSGMFVESVVVDGAGDPTGTPTDDNANPFGETNVNTDSVLNVTTSKTKVYSQGQMLASDGVSVLTSSSTTWTSIYDDVTPVPNNIVDTDVFTFTGLNGEGTAITASFTVETAVTSTSTGTVQDLLDWLETTFDCDAAIDGAGRLVLTDRVADDASTGGYTSQLAITDVTTTGAANPFDDAGQVAPVAGSAFYALSADTSGFDSSREGTNVSWEFVPEALSTNQYANSSTTIFQDQDGFASGFLESVAVDTEGVITGHYSNGQVLKKAKVALANFANLSGLYKEGGNIYRETTESGAPVTGAPGDNGLGSISPNSLEMSNVDLGSEFVKLITVQRGFQANAKIITTTDEMLNELINIKR